MLPSALPVLILLCGLGDLWAISVKSRRLRYLFKPGTMVLIILLALTAWPNLGRFGWLVVAGLLFSLAGDIFLVLPQNPFAAGLASFFCAHVLYVTAFAATDPLTAPFWVLLGFLAYNAVRIFIRLKPGVQREGGTMLQTAVVLYISVISLMVWRALVFGHPLVTTGALLFYVSDLTLAWNRFVRPLRWGELAVMATYFSGQFCLALSVVQLAAP